MPNLVTLTEGLNLESIFIPLMDRINGLSVLLFLVMDECTRELEKNREIYRNRRCRDTQRDRDLPVSIRLGCKSLQITNRPAYISKV